MRERAKPIAAVALAVAAAAAPLPAPAQSAQPLRIGLSAPLTGPDAGFGLGLRLGAEQAVAEINRAGGIGGRKVQLMVQDDAGDPKQGVAAARRLVAAGVRLVVGPLNSGVAAAATAIYEEAGAVVISPGTTWAPLTRRGARLLFRLGGSDAQQGALAGAWLAEHHRDRPVAILHDRTTFGRSLADEVARALRARGGRETVFEGLARGERDVSGLVARLRAAGVAAVYFGGLAPEAAALARGMREAGLAAPLIGSDGLLDRDFATAAGPAAEGTLMTLAPERRLPEARQAGQAGQAGRTPRTPEADAFAPYGYAAIELLRAGVDGAGSREGARVAAYLHGGTALRTAIGEVAFDAQGDLIRVPFSLYAWRRTPDGRIDYAGNAVAP